MGNVRTQLVEQKRIAIPLMVTVATVRPRTQQRLMFHQLWRLQLPAQDRVSVASEQLLKVLHETFDPSRGNAVKMLKLKDLRGVFPPLETLAVETVVAESGEDAVDGLVHPLQAHGALWQLGQLHHRQAGSLRRRRRNYRAADYIGGN